MKKSTRQHLPLAPLLHAYTRAGVHTTAALHHLPCLGPRFAAILSATAKFLYADFLDNASAAELSDALARFYEACVQPPMHVETLRRRGGIVRHGLAYMLRSRDPLPIKAAACLDVSGAYHVAGLGPQFWSALLQALSPQRHPGWTPAMNCVDLHQGLLPPSLGLYPRPFAAAGNGEGGTLFHLLPYIEQGNAYNASYPSDNVFNNNLPTYSQYSTTIKQLIVKTYVCPSDPTYQQGPQGVWSQTTGSYAVNGQVFRGNRWNNSYGTYPASISDGASNTIFFTEKEAVALGPCPGVVARGYNYWQDWGSVIACSRAGQPTGATVSFQVQPMPIGNGCGSIASTGHSGGIQCALGDGSVHFVAQGVSSATWWAALAPAGGDFLGADW